MSFPNTPTNFYLQQANRQVLLTWDLSAGATSYLIQRSTDGVNYAAYATVSINTYLDTAVTVGIQYWYQVAASNGTVSPYTAPQSVIPTPTAEMSLAQLRLMAQQRADRVGSNFVTLPEWNTFINQAMFELYDLLVTADEEFFVATPAQFAVNPPGSPNQTYLYPLPDGNITFTNGIDGTTQYKAAPFYKLKGVDLALNTAQNAWVTVNKFSFIDRNRFVYPNTASTIYGVFNLQYRLLGSNIEFIPTPSAGQNIRIWYIPRLNQLLQDTDITTTGISGWLQYVIIRAAKYALDKEESDTTKLDEELMFLQKRIEETSANRDTGMPDRISDARQNGWWSTMNPTGGYSGPIGGF
jgi:hypothetical protein